MATVDRYSTHGPCWTNESFLAAIGTAPNGAIFFHPFGLRFAPMSVCVDASGELMGRGTWNRYPAIRNYDGFSELASFVRVQSRGT